MYGLRSAKERTFVPPLLSSCCVHANLFRFAQHFRSLCTLYGDDISIEIYFTYFVILNFKCYFYFILQQVKYGLDLLISYIHKFTLNGREKDLFFLFLTVCVSLCDASAKLVTKFCTFYFVFLFFSTPFT